MEGLLDFVLRDKAELFALEVKSASSAPNQPGLDAFCTQFPQARPLVIGPGAVPLPTWFSLP